MGVSMEERARPAAQHARELQITALRSDLKGLSSRVGKRWNGPELALCTWQHVEGAEEETHTQLQSFVPKG